METNVQKSNLKSSLLIKIIILVIIIFGLYISSLYNYLLFHSLAEFFCIIVAFAIFVVVWNSRKFTDNNYLLFIGIAYLFVGSIDFVHTLTYKGMNIFAGFTANISIQFWIAARYLEATTLLIAPLFILRKIRPKVILFIYFLITSGLLIAIFFGIFPNSYIEGSGITIFKEISEYIISIILIGSIYLLYKNKDEFNTRIYKLIIASIILTIFSELAFTFYINTYDFSNIVGYIFKIISFYLIYEAVIVTSLMEPYLALFKKSIDSNKLKDIFIDIVTHDLINFAGPAKYLAKTSFDSEKNPEQKNRLKIIYEANNQIVDMVCNARILAQLESGRKLIFERTNLSDIITSSIKNISYLAKKKKVKIIFSKKEKIFADVNRLINNVFSNIINNAIKYGPKGSKINIKITSDKNNWKVSIADNGIGVPDKHKKNIFKRFQRLDKEGVKGRGLGLAIVDKIVNAHNGKVWVEDNLKGGSIFLVKIPKTQRKT